MKKNNPIRMCVTCRKRESQNTLIRLQLADDNIVTYQGYGRSIYICVDCRSDAKRIRGLARRFRLEVEKLSATLKELDKNG